LADAKVSALTEDTTVLSTDLGYTVEDPGGTPTSKKATWLNILKGSLLGLLTSDGDLVTRTAGAAARLTRASLAADSAFSSTYAPKTTPRQFKQTIYTAGSDYSTSSTTYVDIDATNLPALSLTLAVGDVVALSLTAAWGHSANGNLIGIDWLVDQPTSADTNTRASSYGAWVIELSDSNRDAYSETATSSFTATEAGVHSFKPQWKTNSGANSAKIRGGGTYYTPIRHRVENLGPVTP
jgi:hypothetical protein